MNPESRDIFIKRSIIVNEIRNILNENNYLEVETPILQPIYGGASARPFKTYHNSLDIPLFLRIANELYLKRLIVEVLMVFLNLEKILEMRECLDFIILNLLNASFMLLIKIICG